MALTGPSSSTEDFGGVARPKSRFAALDSKSGASYPSNIESFKSPLSKGTNHQLGKAGKKRRR